MHRLSSIVGAVALILAPTVARGQTTATDTTARAGAVALADGSLAPGDFIDVKIWREPDLSDTLSVDQYGVVVFPKLGALTVTGTRPDSLERRLMREYGQFLQNPSIRVTVLRRINVAGAVARPGLYKVDLTMTIADVLALAGGATTEGRNNQVELRRGSERTVLDLSRGTRVGDTALRSGDQLVVPQRSWASRNTGLIIGGLGTVASLVYLIAR